MNRTLVLLTVLLTAATATAQPKFDAEAAIKKLAPFIDQHTLIVGRVDVRGIDASALVSLTDPLLPADNDVKPVLRAFQNALIQKGAWEIYVVYGANDFPSKPCMLVPIGESPERKDIYELLKEAYRPDDIAWANINGFLCVGGKDGIDKIKARKPSDRADIAQAFTSCGDAPVRLVFAPTAEVRKIFEEVAPTLPAEIGGGSIQTFTRGLKWFALSLGPTPKAEVKLVAQCADVVAAQKIAAVWAMSIQQARNLLKEADPQERTAYTKLYDRAAKLLTPKIDKDRIIVAQELGTELPELAKLLKDVQPAARSVSMNNMKQLGLALHSYADVFGRFPTDIKSKDGKPLLSWRVAILPYIEQQQLYQRFKLDEPWDSEHNSKLIAQMPKIYRSPKQGMELKDRTTYLAPLGKGLMWDDPKGIRFLDITDGTSNTIALVESDDEHAVVWSKPDDIVIDMKTPSKGLIGHWSDGFNALFGDGSVRFVSKDYSAIWAMFTRGGGEPLPEK